MEHVGKRVEIQFRGDPGTPWFAGTICKLNANGSHLVRFDDGDKLNIDLQEHIDEDILRWPAEGKAATSSLEAAASAPQVNEACASSKPKRTAKGAAPQSSPAIVSSKPKRTAMAAAPKSLPIPRKDEDDVDSSEEEDDVDSSEDEAAQEDEKDADDGAVDWATDGQTTGHPYIGQRVAVLHDGTISRGTIRMWVPANEDADDDPALFHMVHDDGDDEDLEEFEVEAAIKRAARRTAGSPRKARSEPVYETQTVEFKPTPTQGSGRLKWGFSMIENYIDARTYVQIYAVDVGSFAARAGVLPAMLLLSINGMPCSSGELAAREVLRELMATSPGEPVRLELRTVDANLHPTQVSAASSSTADAATTAQQPRPPPPPPPPPPAKLLPPPSTEAPEWAMADVERAAIAPVGGKFDIVDGQPRHHVMLSALEALGTTPVEVLAPQASRLLPCLFGALETSPVANVRKRSLDCIATLTSAGVRLDAHFVAVVRCLRDSFEAVAHGASVLLDEQWGIERISAVPHEERRHFRRTLHAILTSADHNERGEPTGVIVSWALDHFFGVDGCGPTGINSPGDLQAELTHLDLNQIEGMLEADLEATRRWYGSLRLPMKHDHAVPKRFVHRERRQPSRGSRLDGWGAELEKRYRLNDACTPSAMAKASSFLDELMAPYVDWNRRGRATVGLARMQQLACAFVLDPPAPPGSSAEPAVPYAAVNSLVATICSLPTPELAESQLAPIVTYLNEGNDPALLGAAVDLICHCERGLLLAHLRRLIGWLATTCADGFTPHATLKQAAKKALSDLGWLALPRACTDRWLADTPSDIGRQAPLLTAEVLAPHADAIFRTFLANDIEFFNGAEGFASISSLTYTFMCLLPSSAIASHVGMLRTMLRAGHQTPPPPPNGKQAFVRDALMIRGAMHLFSKLPTNLMAQNMEAVWELVAAQRVTLVEPETLYSYREDKQLGLDDNYYWRDGNYSSRLEAQVKQGCLALLNDCPVAILAEHVPSLMRFKAFRAMARISPADLAQYIPELVSLESDNYMAPITTTWLEAGAGAVLVKQPDGALDAHVGTVLQAMERYHSSPGKRTSSRGAYLKVMLRKVSDNALGAHLESAIAFLTKMMPEAGDDNGYILGDTVTDHLLVRLAKLDWQAHAVGLAPIFLRAIFLRGYMRVRVGDEQFLSNLCNLVAQIPQAALGSCANLIIGAMLSDRATRDAAKLEIGIAANSYPALSTARIHEMTSKERAKLYDAAVEILARLPKDSLLPHAGILVWFLGELTAKSQQVAFKCVMSLDAQALAADANVLAFTRTRLLKSPVLQRRSNGLRLLLRLVKEAPMALRLTQVEEGEVEGSSSATAFAAPKTRADRLGSNAIQAAQDVAPTHEVYRLSEQLVKAIENPNGVVAHMYADEFADMGWADSLDEEDAAAAVAAPSPSRLKSPSKRGKSGSGAAGDGELSGSVLAKPAKKPRTKRAPDEPKKPSTAYLLWVNCEGRLQAKQALGDGASFSEVGKWCGAAWKAIEAANKMVWDEKASADKARYEREMAEYKSNIGRSPIATAAADDADDGDDGDDDACRFLQL